MLNPESDRINYSDAIIPPKGYELESAVCTTYSLDFEALIAITMALGFSIDAPQKEKENKALMFKALRDISKKLVIFCEAGQIKIPNIPNSMYIMLERMVVPISLDLKNGYYPSFHPKTWLLEYKEKEPKDKENVQRKYRFFVLSRNLTFDKSWDISVFLEGIVEDTFHEKSAPLIPFYDFLNTEATKSNCKNHEIVSNFLAKLGNINFVCDNNSYNEYEIIPLGVSEKYGMNKQKIFNLKDEEKFEDLLIMSPFLTTSVVDEFCEHLNKKSENHFRNNILITRRTALDKINMNNAEYLNIYALKEYFDDIQEETSTQTNKDETQSQEISTVEKRDKDIHGKIFITQINGVVDLYLGSMNATKAAKDDNVEMMIRLKSKNRTISTFVDDILSYKKNKEKQENSPLDLDYFELINLGEVKKGDDSADNNSLKDIIKNICRLNIKAEIKEKEKKVEIKINHELEERNLKLIDFNEKKITISPLSTPNYQVPFTLLNSPNDIIEITYNEIYEISEYYIIAVKEKDELERAVIKIRTDNMPNREDALIKSILSDSKTLLEYFQILFSDNSQNIYDLISSKNEHNVKHQGKYTGDTAFYEMMLKTALNNEIVWKEFKTILSKAPKNSDILQKLNLLYNQFEQAMNQV